MSKRNDLQEIIDRANKVHNYAYDYSLLKNHKSMHDYVDIICPKHGVFSMTMHSHTHKKRGCKQCAIDKCTYSKEKFIENAKKVHGDKYNYDKVIYITGRKKVIITCPLHGDFKQQPRDHVNSKQGCPICSESKGEKEIRIILKKLSINFIQEKKFLDLKFKKFLYFDFYLPDYNVCIEFDGEQHFAPFDIFGGLESFEIIKQRDELKKIYCENNNIKLLNITYLDEDIEKIIKDFLSIKEHKILRFLEL